MARLFSKIRYNLTPDKNNLKYLRYAIGEIVLVVIGILIALQINNWNEDYKNANKEKGYLINLQHDLTADTVRLNELKYRFELALKSKRNLLELFDLKNPPSDSLNILFDNQINFANDFVPNSSTFDELKNSNGLNLISNPQLRRQIVILYNSYNALILRTEVGAEKARTIMAYTNKFVKNIFNITNDEMYTLMNDNFFKNEIRVNNIYNQFTSVGKAYQNCVETLNLIEKELKR